MLADLRQFLAELTGGQKPQQTFAENDYRRAAAALLVHVATLDGDLTEAKRAKLRAILAAQFALEAAAVDELMWEMVYADGVASEFESNVMWRVADLLAVSARDRIALRERVAAARAG